MNSNLKKIIAIIFPVIILLTLGFIRQIYMGLGKEIVLTGSIVSDENQYYGPNSSRKSVVEFDGLDIELSKIPKNIINDNLETIEYRVYIVLENKDGVDTINSIQKDIPKGKKYIIGYMNEILDKDKHKIDKFTYDENIENFKKNAVYARLRLETYYPFVENRKDLKGRIKIILYKIGDSYIFYDMEKI